MYYLYGIGKSIFVRTEEDEDLSKVEEQPTLILKEMPVAPEIQEGKSIVLYIDPETMEASWIYEEINQEVD